jgi:GDPmannose 4,6-dehydratase
MLQQDSPDDYVIATGESHGLEDFVRLAFAAVDLDWRDHTEVSPEPFRASDIKTSTGNAAKAHARLSWKPVFGMADVVEMMVRAEIQGGDRLAWLEAGG